MVTTPDEQYTDVDYEAFQQESYQEPSDIPTYTVFNFFIDAKTVVIGLVQSSEFKHTDGSIEVYYPYFLEDGKLIEFPTNTQSNAFVMNLMSIFALGASNIEVVDAYKSKLTEKDISISVQ